MPAALVAIVAPVSPEPPSIVWFAALPHAQVSLFRFIGSEGKCTRAGVTMPCPSCYAPPQQPPVPAVTVCARSECDQPGDRAPKLVFVMEAASQQFEIPAILGVLFCATCARAYRATDFLAADDRIVKALLAARPGARHVDTRLEWVAPTDPDYKRLQAMRSN